MTKNHPDIETSPNYHYLQTAYSIEHNYTRKKRRETLTLATLCSLVVAYFLILTAPLIVPATIALLVTLATHI